MHDLAWKQRETKRFGIIHEAAADGRSLRIARIPDGWEWIVYYQVEGSKRGVSASLRVAKQHAIAAL